MRNRLLLLVISFLFVSFLYPSENSPNKKTVCLNMIVKNEKDVIARCLQSVLPFIDTWVIVDTGSTDGTQQIIQEFMKDIPGKLYERPWVNFAHNRQEALLLAKEQADYLLFMDADDVLTYSKDFTLPDLTKDFYAILSRHPKEEFWIHRLVKAKLPWFWDGVLHEDLLCEQSLEGQSLEGIVYQYVHDGARSKDPNTLKKDIQILSEAVKNDPNNPRNYFYLARTYMHAGDVENALKYFQIRSEMKGSPEELFSAKLVMAKIHSALNSDPKLIRKSFFSAYQARPQRVEPLYYIAKNFREQGEFKRGYEVASAALELPPNPNDYHCLEQWVYDYGLLFELAFCAARVDQTKEAIEICNKVLSRESLPENVRMETEGILEFVYRLNVEKVKGKIEFLVF